MGRIRIGVAVVLFAVSSQAGLTGCATTAPTPASAAPRAEPARAASPAIPDAPAHSEPLGLPEVVRHTGSGMRFPAQLEGFDRDEVNRHDAVGDDVSVGYLRTSRDLAMTATVYVYPAQGPLDAQFAGAKTAILQHRAGAELIGEGEMQLFQRNTLRTGRRAHYLVRDPSGELPLMVSHLFLFQHGPWFIKFRATFLAEQHEDCDDALLRFMSALDWPDLHPGRLAALTRRGDPR